MASSHCAFDDQLHACPHLEQGILSITEDMPFITYAYQSGSVVGCKKFRIFASDHAKQLVGR
mgnify:CR=1 FL=1